VAFVLGVYGFLGFVSLVKEEWLKAHWKLVDLVPSLPLGIWLAIGCALLFVLSIEGSLELTTKNKAAHDTAIDTARNVSDETLKKIEAEHTKDSDLLRQKIESLKQEIQIERDKSGIPEVNLEFTADEPSFVLYNSGSADADRVQVGMIRRNDAVVYWDLVPRIAAKGRKPVALSITDAPNSTWSKPDLSVLLSVEATPENPIVKVPVLITYRGRGGERETLDEIQYDAGTRKLTVFPGVSCPVRPTSQVIVDRPC
jgi:hypothetical protein